MLELEIPRTLPVDHLSVSAVNLFLKCPEKWRRKYIDREYEPPSSRMILGSAVGASEGFAYQTEIDTGERPATADVTDLFASEWDERINREAEVAWDDAPGELKDSGVGVIQVYEQTVAPAVVPVSVERDFDLTFPDVDWTLTGRIDLEDEDGTVADLKVRGKKMSATDADADLQPTTYLLARRSEGNPAPEFRYHAMVTTKKPYAEVVSTDRTDQQLDQFVDRMYRVAAEIHWRMETGNWQGAPPGAWWCAERSCGYWPTCEFGGLK